MNRTTAWTLISLGAMLIPTAAVVATAQSQPSPPAASWSNSPATRPAAALTAKSAPAHVATLVPGRMVCSEACKAKLDLANGVHKCSAGCGEWCNMLHKLCTKCAATAGACEVCGEAMAVGSAQKAAATQPTAAIRPVAVTTQPATSSKPAEKELLSVPSFKRIRDHVLAHGDRQTYCQMYNNNPHTALGGVDIFLNPATGQENISCDPKLSGFNEVVIRTQKMAYYRITLDQARSTLNCPIPDDGKKDDLRKYIQSILADLEQSTETPTPTKAVEAH